MTWRPETAKTESNTFSDLSLAQINWKMGHPGY